MSLQAVLAAAVVLFVAGSVAAQWRRRKLAAEKQRIGAEAAARGMSYSGPQDAARDLSTGAGAPRAAEGTHVFTGVTHDIPWTIETVLLASADSDAHGSASRDIARSWTRWSTAACAPPGGAYILLMDLPEGASREKILAAAKAPAGGGMLASIANRAGVMLLGLFVRSLFGAEQANATPLDATHRVGLPPGPLAQLYIAYSNDPVLVARVLVPEVADFIAETRTGQLSFLLNARGLAAAMPAARIEADEVERLSAFCSELAARIVRHGWG